MTTSVWGVDHGRDPVSKADHSVKTTRNREGHTVPKRGTLKLCATDVGTRRPGVQTAKGSQLNRQKSAKADQKGVITRWYDNPVSKADTRPQKKGRRFKNVNTALGAFGPAGALAAGGYSASRAKTGRKVEAGVSTGAMSVAGNLTGGLAGAAVSRRAMVPGAMAGGALGARFGADGNLARGNIKGAAKPRVSKAFRPVNDKQRKNQANKKIVGGAGIAGLGLLGARSGGRALGQAATTGRIAAGLGGRAGTALGRSAGVTGLRGLGLGGAGVAGAGVGAGLIGSGVKDRKKLR